MNAAGHIGSELALPATAAGWNDAAATIPDLAVRTRSAPWARSTAAVLAVHGLVAAAFLVTVTVPPPPIPPAAVMIDLAPPAPQPQMAQAAPPPPPVPPEARPEPEPPPMRKAEVALPKPPPKPRVRPKEPVRERLPEPPVETPTMAPQVTPQQMPAAAPAAAAAPQTAPPAAVSGNALPSWQGSLLAHLERHKRYPNQAQYRRQQGVATVRFVMDRMGNVLSARLERSSGIESLDDEAVNLPTRAQPLPVPPPEVSGDTITLVVPVQFFLTRR